MEPTDREGDLVYQLAIRIPAAIYLFLSFLMWLSFSGLVSQFTNSNFSLMVRVAASVGIIILGAFIVLLSGNLDRLRLLWSAFCYAFVTFVILITVTLIINIINQNSMSVMSRGMSDTLWQCMMVLVAFSAVYLFGSKAVLLTLIPAAAAYGVVILFAMAQFGPATVIVDWLNMLIGKGRDTPATRALEIHTLIFGVGVFFYYYLLNLRTKKNAFLWMSVAFSVVMLGFKRSLIPGVILCRVLYAFFHKVKAKMGEKSTRTLIAIFSVAMMAVSMGYIVFIRSGMLNILVEELELDTQGRIEMYAAVEKVYTFSPSYLGMGQGWISRNIVALTGNENASPQIHCNFLEVYIELGFWGYLAFLGYRMVSCPRLLGKRYGTDMSIFYFCIYLYSWITYFTDNTVFYWPNNLTTWICLFSEVVDQTENQLLSGITRLKKEKADEN